MIITLKNLAELREDIGSNKKITMASGSFDIVHSDHVRYLRKAKECGGDILVVAVKSDNAVRLKGSDRPINSEEERAFVIDNFKMVDYTVIVPYDHEMSTDIPADNLEQEQWLTMFEPIVKELNPDIWVHEESAKLSSARKRLFEKYEVKGIAVPRGKNNSTTSIIEKIKK